MDQTYINISRYSHLESSSLSPGCPPPHTALGEDYSPDVPLISHTGQPATDILLQHHSFLVVEQVKTALRNRAK